MPRYDIKAIKSAAAGRWPEIFAAVASVDPGLFDGLHHPCPKCGGTDRFRFIDPEAGAAICNQCFTTKNGDGLAVIQWLNGCDFNGAVKPVADYLGIKPEKGKKKASPDEYLEFLPWNSTLVGLWCLKKKPIKPEAVEAVGARLARYRGEYTVVAIPIWGPSLREADPVGWVLYRTDGGDLPRGPRGNIEWVKVLLAPGSDQGIITAGMPDKPSSLLWKTEGPTDLLALLSMMPADEPSFAFTTGSGTTEKPLDWIVKLCEGHRVMVVHDADEPGQNGATWLNQRDGRRRPGWCPTLAESAQRVVNVRLPFPIEKTHGPDIRDFFNGGSTYQNLIELIGSAEEFKKSGKDLTAIEEAENDPHRLARINLAQYEGKHGSRLVFWRDEWWKYKSGAYQKIARNDLRSKINAAIREEFVSQWKERRAAGDDDKPVRIVTPSLTTSVIEAMQSMCRVSWNIEMQTVISTREKKNWISMVNGILDLDAVFAGKPAEECLVDHSSDWFSTVKLEYPFESDADCPLWLEYLDRTFEGDQERIDLVQEWAGYLLTPGNPEQKFLAMEGDGGNGKTVFLSAMVAMIGAQNISFVPLEKFGGRFDLYATVGKMANICGDVGDIDRIAEGHLKDFTGGGAMSFDRKGIDPIECIPTAKLMLSWNTRPRFRDRSQGLWRRMLLVPFNRKVPEAEKIAGMATPEWWIRQGEASGILLWAIRGLYRLRRRGYFIQPEASLEAIGDYQKEANPALEFFEDHIERASESYVKAEWLYRVYHHWCEKSGVKPLGNRQFGKEVRKQFPEIERKRVPRHQDPSRPWVYEKIKFSSDEVFSLNTEEEKKLF